MIQRFIFDALKDGIAQINADLTIIEQLFRDVYCLDEAEIAGIKVVWAAQPPEVRHGYAPLDIEVPTFSIVLSNETETEKWLGNLEGQVLDGPDFGADILGTLWTHNYNILVYTKHPDVTAYYYEIAKTIILERNEFFADLGLMDIDISGQDLMPDSRYIPEHFFARTMQFNCMRKFSRIDRDSKLGKAFKVAGIHVDKSGSPSDVGGVKTQVTPVFPSLEEGTE